LTLHWMGGGWRNVEIQYYFKTFLLFVTFLIIEIPIITGM